MQEPLRFLKVLIRRYYWKLVDLKLPIEIILFIWKARVPLKDIKPAEANILFKQSIQNLQTRGAKRVRGVQMVNSLLGKTFALSCFLLLIEN